jgi:hypothetical protein
VTVYWATKFWEPGHRPYVLEAERYRRLRLERRRACGENHGADHQMELVDESHVEQPVPERVAPGDENVATLVALELADACGCVLAGNSRRPAPATVATLLPLYGKRWPCMGTHGGPR